LAAITLGFDQWTKFLASKYLHGPLTLVGSFLYLNQTANDGAAWGIFAGKRLFLITISICAAVGIILFRKKLQLHGRFRGMAFGLLLGGICGNLLDRLRLGAVIDFIDVHLPFYRWPTFNLADAAICLGVLILLLSPE
jgi:signal peptidase II